MFRQLSSWLGPNPANAGEPLLFQFHPLQLSTLLEAAWSARRTDRFHPRPSQALPPRYLQNQVNLLLPPGPWIPVGGVVWDHLIYAFLIESTGIYDIFGRVISEFARGEKLRFASGAGQRWLRTTEQLFYSVEPPFAAFGLTSTLRPDLGMIRRDTYYRMFGVSTDSTSDGFAPVDGFAYNSSTSENPTGANSKFVATLEGFLHHVWHGIINANNLVGQNTTEMDTIADHARQLFNMMVSRRTNGNLSREEFWFVAMMSWFHLTLEQTHTPILSDLRANLQDPAANLELIGDQVGLPPHPCSYDFFELADPLSALLTMIESGRLNHARTVGALLTPGTSLNADVHSVINHWSKATGRNVRCDRVTVS